MLTVLPAVVHALKHLHAAAALCHRRSLVPADLSHHTNNLLLLATVSIVLSVSLVPLPLTASLQGNIDQVLPSTL